MFWYNNKMSKLTLKELKNKCKEFGIKGCSNKRKNELIQIITDFEKKQEEMKLLIYKILDLGEKKYTISRGLAIHIDYCPINICVWNGKSYANLTDDCIYCDYCLAFSENLGNYDFPEQYIICGGKNDISISDLGVEVKNFERPRIPFDKQAHIEKLRDGLENENKLIYECNRCGYIGLMRDDKLCYICECDDLNIIK